MFNVPVDDQMHLIHGMVLWKAAMGYEMEHMFQMLLQLCSIVNPKLSHLK